ncbi:MAG: hypothetical protein WAN76_04110, partial [Candidatus Sulfotelmatobacter sp.]
MNLKPPGLLIILSDSSFLNFLVQVPLRDKSHRHGSAAPLTSKHEARPISIELGREETAMTMTAERTVRE